MTHNEIDTAPALTPFPRRNHLALLRRERAARRTRRLIGAAAAAGIVLSGSAAVAATVPPRERVVAQPTQAADDPGTVAVVEATVNRAQAALEGAHPEADTTTLEKEIAELDAYEKLPPVVVRGEAIDTERQRQQVVAQTAALVQADADEAARKAEERKAAEAAVAAAEAAAAANTPAGAKATAQRLAADTYGWGADQFGCLESLWNKESGWNYQASNPSSGAYGIPQSLPGSKMATVAADWATNATTQITWGLDYISRAYGTPCAAWGHSQSVNWY